MQMQEPEQGQRFEQEWLADHEYRGYRAKNSGSFEPEQQQKIHPQAELSLRAKVLWIIVTILSSLGFFLSVAGIVAAAIVLQYANGQQAVLVGGIIGLIISIGVLLVCVAMFVIAVVTLAGRARRRLRWTGASH